MTAEPGAIEVVSEGGIQRESIAVKRNYRHELAQAPLNIRTPA
jgi:hypothetical protein